MSGYKPKSDEREVEVFITKYALTNGIEKVGGTTRDGRYVSVKTGDVFGSYTYGPGAWVETEEQAIAEFHHLRDKKIKSLKRQLAKIEAMKDPTFIGNGKVDR